MRFMMLIKADRNSEAGVMPGRELIAAMGKFNEDMVNAGVLLAVRDSSRAQKGRASGSPVGGAL